MTPSIQWVTQERRRAAVRLLQAQYDEHGIELSSERLDSAVAGMIEMPERGALLVALDGDEPVGLAVLSYAWTLEHGGRSPGWTSCTSCLRSGKTVLGRHCSPGRERSRLASAAMRSSSRSTPGTAAPKGCTGAQDSNRCRVPVGRSIFSPRAQSHRDTGHPPPSITSRWA